MHCVWGRMCSASSNPRSLYYEVAWGQGYLKQDVFQSNTNLGISLYGSFIFHLLPPLHLAWELLLQDDPANKGNGLCIRYEAEEMANPINTFDSLLGEIWRERGWS